VKKGKKNQNRTGVISPSSVALFKTPRKKSESWLGDCSTTQGGGEESRQGKFYC
jgi:hypothetical protein